jgi:glycosidase
MGEDLAAEGRMAVRTPMQWSSGPNGGFSTARPGRLVSRVVPDGYGPEHVNVADQRRDPESLWSFLHTLMRAYRSCPELGWGTFRLLDQPVRSVLAQCCATDDAAVVTLHNLAAEPVTTRVAVADRRVELVDLLGRDDTVTDDRGVLEVNLEGYGFRWLRLHAGGPPRLP